MQTAPYEIDPYNPPMARKLSKHRPSQGARLVALRKAAGLSQVELARLIGETQQNVAYWEQSERPPRSDALPKLAEVLGVKIEDILGEGQLPARRRHGPVGKVQRLFDEVARLPRGQQEKVVQFVDALLAQFRRAG